MSVDPMRFDTIGIVGGGAFGTALAETLCRAGRDVVLWARNTAVVNEITASRTNTGYLPGVPLSASLRATTDIAIAASRSVVLLVTPVQQSRVVMAAMRPHLRPGTPVILCSKGIEQASGNRLADVLAEELPCAIPAVMSGPSFAHDVVRGLPVALTIATADKALGESLSTAIGYRYFRLYWSDDLIGVQIGGAVKNVLAIAAGILDGKGLGASAHAALVTRGFVELRRFAQVQGARSETLMGLSGLGDLLLTCGSAQSRNMSLGRALGQGTPLADILGTRKSVSEGVFTASAATALAAKLGIEMPVSEAVAAIVTGQLSVDAAIAGLLARPFKPED
jgi:glycerol-3-phosphate dehydrogenase (NAD(P)+)